MDYILFKLLLKSRIQYYIGGLGIGVVSSIVLSQLAYTLLSKYFEIKSSHSKNDSKYVITLNIPKQSSILALPLLNVFNFIRRNFLQLKIVKLFNFPRQHSKFKMFLNDYLNA